MLGRRHAELRDKAGYLLKQVVNKRSYVVLLLNI